MQSVHVPLQHFFLEYIGIRNKEFYKWVRKMHMAACWYKLQKMCWLVPKEYTYMYLLNTVIWPNKLLFTFSPITLFYWVLLLWVTILMSTSWSQFVIVKKNTYMHNRHEFMLHFTSAPVGPWEPRGPCCPGGPCV